MITKERLIEAIQSMPENKFEDINELIDKIHLWKKLNVLKKILK